MSGAKAMVAIVARRPTIPMLATSQKPERVSNILRSSTRTSRASGTGRISVAWVGLVRTDSTAMAVMLLSSLVGCRR